MSVVEGAILNPLPSFKVVLDLLFPFCDNRVQRCQSTFLTKSEYTMVAYATTQQLHRAVMKGFDVGTLTTLRYESRSEARSDG